MTSLTIDLFLNTNSDEEARRYRILDGFQSIRKEFAQNRVYPALSQLMDLDKSLTTVLTNAEAIEKELPRTITGVDLKSHQLIYRPVTLDKSSLNSVRELIQWAQPTINQHITEGQTIFNFVDEHLEIEEIGLVPQFVEEGYLLIPDLLNLELNVYSYHVTIITSSGERYRNLKTQLIHTLPWSTLRTSPQQIKMQLMQEHQELPNPATFLFETDLEFPFNETVLPIAKRKLLRQIYS